MSIYLFAGVIIDFATFTLMCLLKYTRTRAQVLWTISPKYRNIGRKKVMLCQRSSKAHIKNPFEMRCKHQIDYMQQYIACIIEKSAVCFLLLFYTYAHLHLSSFLSFRHWNSRRLLLLIKIVRQWIAFRAPIIIHSLPA